MFGAWNGERTRLEHLGITFSFLSVNDFLADGKGDDANWSRVRGTMDVDFGKAELFPGLRFHVTGLWQGGGNMGAYIGSIANPSSLVSADTARLDSWWFEQALANDKLFVRVGQFAGLDFYGVQADGASYILEPLGYAIGNLFPADYESFDPAATPAAEIRFAPSKHIYFKSAIFSGNRNPYHDDISGFHLKFKDSPVIATEAGYLVAPDASTTKKTYPGSYKFGATTNPGPFTDIVTGARSSTNYLLYFMANQTIYRQQAGSDRGLDFNFAFDWTPDSFTRNYSQITGGLRYHGLVPHRGNDTLAVGVVYSRISPELNRAYTSLGLLPFGSEKAVEVNYALKVTRWFTFQPVVQHYFDTGANPTNRSSTVAGFRTTFVL
jgi:carbohydrate-selective porin OprB